MDKINSENLTILEKMRLKFDSFKDEIFESKNNKDLKKFTFPWKNQSHLIKIIDEGDPVIISMCVRGWAICDQFKGEFLEAARKFGIHPKDENCVDLQTEKKQKKFPGEKSAKFIWIDCGSKLSATEFCKNRVPENFPTVELFYANKKPKAENSPLNLEEKNEPISVSVFRSHFHLNCYGLREFLRFYGHLKDFRPFEATKPEK
eukprot:Sdes_comp19889_c0_seq2m12219